MVKGQVIISLRIIWNVLPERRLSMANWAHFLRRLEPHYKGYTEEIWLRQ